MNTTRLIQEIRYQLNPGPGSAWSACIKDCGSNSRGGWKCIDCLEDELSEAVGNSLAERFVEHTKETARLVGEIELEAERREGQPA